MTVVPVSDAPVLEAIDLVRHFEVRGGSARSRLRGKRVVHAVDGVSISLAAGEIVAVVGESGSGKTTVGRLMTRLERPTSGTLLLRGEPVPAAGISTLRSFRRDVQMVFQDPFASLNPAHRVAHHLERPLLIHDLAHSQAEARAKAAELLERVHLTPASQYLPKFPGELSGGQRQRIAIARALAVDPAVIVADEPVSMLDVSIRLSVLNLFDEIAKDGRAILYITHDIASARYFADRMLVMYGGQVVEHGPAEQVATSPQHPYTQLLVESAPDPDRGSVRAPLAARAGEASSLVKPPSGCRFHPRCPHAMDICNVQAPPAFAAGDHRGVACWLLADEPPEARGAESNTDARAASARTQPGNGRTA